MTDADSKTTKRSETLLIAVLLCTTAGVALTFGGLLGLTTGVVPMPAAIAFISAGLIEGLAALFGAMRKRAAWAFACSLNGTLAAVALLGTPKLADTLAVPRTVALVPTFVFAAATMLMAMSESDMRN